MIIRRQTATFLEIWPTNKSTEDGSSSFFNYTRMEVLESKRATPTIGEHLNLARSWPERQERSGSVAEAPRLTMA